jgi:mannose-6-phosphate isomerase-like protein (cupin superfamily)
MDDVTVKRLGELESYEGKGQFCYAGKSLGVGSFGMNVLNLPAGWPDYPEHDHAEDRHEEVYVVLRGSAELRAGDRTWQLQEGSMARVAPAVARRILPGASGVVLLALGGTTGKAYSPSWGRRTRS